eukprot:TRINITY_DN412_c0_g1_i1.p1 TRINITY_DN412_c0_g1~~TRINITY_DN412_c0_g1_i1.p1  ORF type:complete len:877 (+),score=196.50 TRINITY_DN412_c0_g1_i1:107-2632(+)
MASFFLLFVVLATLVVASTAWENDRISAPIDASPNFLGFDGARAYGWSHIGRVDRASSFSNELSFGIKKRNVDKLHEIASSIIDPFHPEFRSFRTVSELNDLVRPTISDQRSLLAHLESHGIGPNRYTLSHDGSFVVVRRALVGEVEDMLSTEIHAFQHQHDPSVIIHRAVTEVLLPTSVHGSVEFLTGVSNFAHPARMVERKLKSGMLTGGRSSTSSIQPRFDPSDPLYPYGIDLSEFELKVRLGNFEGIESYFLCCNGPEDCSFTSNLTHLCIDSEKSQVMKNLVFEWKDGSPGAMNPQYSTPSASDYSTEIVADEDTGFIKWRVLFNKRFWSEGQHVVVRANATFEGASFVKAMRTTDVYIPRTSQLSSLRSWYHVPPNMKATQRDKATYYGGVCVVQFVNCTFSDEDLHEFCEWNDQEVPTVSREGGGEGIPDGEPTLDIQYVTGMGRGLPATLYLNDIQDFGASMLQYLHDVPTLTLNPRVHSISWGGQESTWGVDVLTSANDELAKLAAAGYTILVASGDDGVIDDVYADQDCNCTNFCVDFPSSSPYTTGVGGTMRVLGGSAPISMDFAIPEEYVDVSIGTLYGGMIDSGGGYSRYFGQPAYQKGITTDYFQRWAKEYNISSEILASINPNNRGVPDISVSAQGFPIILNGEKLDTGGTSASSPTLAGMLGLLNDRLEAAGKKPLGHFAPLAYAAFLTNPEVFEDVRIGSNEGTRGNGVYCDEAYHADFGWDTVSGLGILNFDHFVQYVLADGQSVYLGAAKDGTNGSNGLNGSNGSDGDDGSVSTNVLVLILVSVGVSILLNIVVVALFMTKMKKLPRHGVEAPLLGVGQERE